MFYKLSKLDPANALRRAFDTIVEMNNVPDKFRILLHALEEAGLLISFSETVQLKQRIKIIYENV